MAVNGRVGWIGQYVVLFRTQCRYHTRDIRIAFYRSVNFAGNLTKCAPYWKTNGMTEQTIQSQDIKVADVFQAFYTVPDYQREYVWKTEQVEQLLSDINAELAGNDPTTAPEYFIGSIVVCPGSHGVLELIDGQQRMTTLFLILCAIRDRIKELKEKPPGALASQIAATSTDAAGQDHFRYRLELQYEDSGDILVRAAQGTLDGADVTLTRSIDNIRNAYEVTLNFLRQELGNDASTSRIFYGYLTNKVKLIL